MSQAALGQSTRKLSDVLSRSEIRRLTQRSNWRGAGAIAFNWALIAAAFAIVARWPNPLTIALALVVIAGRQLGLAILQHEGSHRTLFERRWLNDVLTDWLCARPVWQHLPKYREHHKRHHLDTGTDRDPDITLHDGFPASRSSMARKMARDITGVTGLKTVLALTLMDAEVIRWTVANDVKRLPLRGRSWISYPLTFLRNAGGMLATNAALLAILAATGHAWLYGIWVMAFLTPMPLFVRIRSIAEHGCVERVPDVLQNTRSTRAAWWLRLTVAPHRVNFHIEHHLAAGVPYYRLPEMHRLLEHKGFVGEMPSYGQVLRLAASG